MTAQLIDGKAIAKKVRADVAQRVADFTARYRRKPGLDVILVGDDPASRIYVRKKERACDDLGIRGTVHALPEATSQAELLELIDRLNRDDTVDGVLIQIPLPAHLDANLVLASVTAAKDVDGLTPLSAGLLALGRPGLRPCTPAGCLRLLDEIGCDPRGKRAVVVGRSNLVGKPTALMLLERNATVTITHSRTADLRAAAAEADILIVAVGKPNVVPGSWVKPGAVVLDLGMNRADNGRLCGDVDFEGASERASWMTPVPGGVGPMSVAMLLDNTVRAAFMRAEAAAGEPAVQDTHAE